MGVRVRVDGAWGSRPFAVSTAERWRRPSDGRSTIARARPRAAVAALSDEPPASGSWEGGTGGTRSVHGLDRGEALRAYRCRRGDARRSAGRTSPRPASSRIARSRRSHRRRLSLPAAHVECGGGITATAVDGRRDAGPLLSRFLPRPRGAGRLRALRRAGPRRPRATRGRGGGGAAERAGLPGRTHTLVLDGEQLALQVHESVGHAVELDRVLGLEASYAGTSFVSPGDLGSLRYGSPHMNVTADATGARGLGSFGWDDEGVPAQAVSIVRDGVLCGFLSSRESAAEVGLERSGDACARRRSRASRSCA